MKRKKKISLSNVSDSLSDNEMKQLKGLGWNGYGFYNIPNVDWIYCCEPGDPMLQCRNGFGQYVFSTCLCMTFVYIPIAYEECCAATGQGCGSHFTIIDPRCMISCS